MTKMRGPCWACSSDQLSRAIVQTVGADKMLSPAAAQTTVTSTPLRGDGAERLGLSMAREISLTLGLSWIRVRVLRPPFETTPPRRSMRQKLSHEPTPGERSALSLQAVQHPRRRVLAGRRRRPSASASPASSEAAARYSRAASPPAPRERGRSSGTGSRSGVRRAAGR